MDTIKILLISDLHLGVEHINPLVSRDERLNTLGRIISLARKHDILLIAGDLINDENIDPNYYTILNNEFSSLIDENIEIYFTPGYGEMTAEGDINPSILSLNTTFTFSDNKDENMIRSSRGDIYIYGQQYCSSKENWSIKRKEQKGFHLGLFYADFSPQANGNPETSSIKKDDIKKMNLDFYALGKNHAFKLFRMANKILGAYAGSAEPCSMDETGDRFVISIELEGDTLKNIKRIAANTGKILSGEIDCSALINQSSLYEKIRSSYPEKSIVKIVLTGERDFPMSNSISDELSGYFRGLKIFNRSIPTLKIMVEENSESNTLTGIFFSTLNEEIEKNPANRYKSDIIAGIIFNKSLEGENGGSVICDF